MGVAPETGHLGQGVDPGVGPAGTDYRDLPAGHDEQRRFDLALNGSVVFLALPAMVVGAVVFDNQFKGLIHSGS